jgi:hypothetical protein
MLGDRCDGNVVYQQRIIFGPIGNQRKNGGISLIASATVRDVINFFGVIDDSVGEDRR